MHAKTSLLALRPSPCLIIATTQLVVPLKVTIVATLRPRHLHQTRRQIEPGNRLAARLQTSTLHLAVEDRLITKANNDVQFQPLHQPSTRRDHRPVTTSINILWTWTQTTSDSTNLFPCQGSKGHHPGQHVINQAASQACMVESTIQQLPTAAPTPPTTWNESQVHRQTNFQTISNTFQEAEYLLRYMANTV